MAIAMSSRKVLALCDDHETIGDAGCTRAFCFVVVGILGASQPSLRGAPISGLPEIGIMMRKSGKPDLRATKQSRFARRGCFGGLRPPRNAPLTHKARVRTRASLLMLRCAV